MLSANYSFRGIWVSLVALLTFGRWAISQWGSCCGNCSLLVGWLIVFFFRCAFASFFLSKSRPTKGKTAPLYFATYDSHLQYTQFSSKTKGTLCMWNKFEMIAVQCKRQPDKHRNYLLIILCQYFAAFESAFCGGFRRYFAHKTDCWNWNLYGWRNRW